MTKRFYTLAEYNNINAAKLKPFEDQWGRDIIYAALQNCSASPIKEFQQNATLSASKGNCYYDLLMTLENGEKYVIEVKYRGNDFDSKSFPTHLINVEKFQSFYKALVNKEITNGLVCSIWSDGVIWFSHMGKYSSIEQRKQNKTTNVSKATDGKKVLKWCYMYKPDFIRYVCAEFDGQNWKPYISETPIDVNQLNNASYKLF